MYNEIKSIKEPTEEDCYLGIISAYQREVDGLQQENKQLKEDLRVSQSNEETYSLEMQEITKILGLAEETLFDEVKDYAKRLKSYNNLCIKQSFTTRKLNNLKSILTELEKWLKSYLYMLNGITDKDIYEKQQLDDFADFMDKIQELKEKYK